MNRFQTALASLVAALPAALLATVLVMVLLNYGVSGLMLQVLLFGTLAVTLPVGLLPALILVFWGRKRAATEDDPSETVRLGNDDVGIGDGVIVSDADDTEIAETVDFDTGSLPEEGLEAVDEEPDADEIDEAVFLEDDEQPPKKKKK